MPVIPYFREEQDERITRAALYRRMAQSMDDEAMADRFFRLADALQDGRVPPEPTPSPALSLPSSQGEGWQALNETLRREADRQLAANPVLSALLNESARKCPDESKSSSG